MGQHWTSGWMGTRRMTRRQQDYSWHGDGDGHWDTRASGWWALGRACAKDNVGANTASTLRPAPGCFKLCAVAATSIIEAGGAALAFPHPVPGQVPAGGPALLSTQSQHRCRHVGTGQPLRRAGRQQSTSSPAAMSIPIAKSFYDLSATSLQGEKVDFNVFRGRVVLIENVASL